MKRITGLILFLCMFAFFTGCSTYQKTLPDAQGVFSNTQCEVGYTLEVRQNAEGTNYAFVRFNFYRDLLGKHQDRYYTYKSTVLTPLEQYRYTGEETGMWISVYDNGNTYPVTYLFIDTDTETPTGMAPLPVGVDLSENAYVDFEVKKLSIKIGDVHANLEIGPIIQQDDQTTVSATIIISYENLWLEDGTPAVDVIEENGAYILIEQKSGRRFLPFMLIDGERFDLEFEDIMIYRGQGDVFVSLDASLTVAEKVSKKASIRLRLQELE